MHIHKHSLIHKISGLITADCIQPHASRPLAGHDSLHFKALCTTFLTLMQKQFQHLLRPCKGTHCWQYTLLPLFEVFGSANHCICVWPMCHLMRFSFTMNCRHDISEDAFSTNSFPNLCPSIPRMLVNSGKSCRAMAWYLIPMSLSSKIHPNSICLSGLEKLLPIQ